MCTTCTISYIFGEPPASAGAAVSSDLMVFKTDGLTVKVDFYNVNLKIESTPETVSTWEMDIGYISKTFQLPDYFDNFQENMLGMAPMLTSDATLLNR